MAEVARRLCWHGPQVDRGLDVQNGARLDMVFATQRAIGCQLHVTATGTTDSVVALSEKSLAVQVICIRPKCSEEIQSIAAAA